MVRRAARSPRGPDRPAPDEPSPSVDTTAATESDPEGAASASAGLPLDGLGVVGITRRRVAGLLAAIVATWIVIVFARQVGEASAASARAAEIQAQNGNLAANVAALRRELQTIQQEPFIRQQARANSLGDPNERPFRLAPGLPALPANAPGSDVTRLGSLDRHDTPLESWLSLLFGSGGST